MPRRPRACGHRQRADATRSTSGRSFLTYHVGMKRTTRVKRVKPFGLLDDRSLSAVLGGTGEPVYQRLDDAPSNVVTDYSPDSDRVVHT